jgi:DNA polymerase III epsilon subunit family exonuclease
MKKSGSDLKKMQRLTEQMLNRPLSSLFFTAFDFETTGLYPDKDRIIEIGAIKFNLAGDEFKFSGLINPCTEIPPEASKINGIDDSMVLDKPVIEEIMPDFLTFIDGTVLVAHNIGFDASFLMHNIDRLNRSVDDLICIDTILMAKNFFKGLYSYSLGNIVKALGIELENAHRAEDDAVACKKLFSMCVEKIPDNKYLELKDFLKKSGLRKKSLLKDYSKKEL